MAQEQGVEPVPLSRGPWEAMIALEEARFDRASRAPAGLIAAAILECAVGVGGLVLSEDPTAGAILVAGGAAHGAIAGFSIESNRRKKRAFRARLDSVDPARTSATAATAEAFRLAAEHDARANSLALGVHLALPLAGVASELLDCSRLLGPGCEPEPVLAFGLVGLVGSVHSATRWRAAARLGNDLAFVDQAIPTVLP